MVSLRSTGISHVFIVMYGQPLKHRQLMSCSQAKLPSASNRPAAGPAHTAAGAHVLQSLF